MALISLREYAELHGKACVSVRQKVARGGFTTARKIGNTWVIDSDEPYTDARIRSGDYIGFRNREKTNP